MSHRARQVRKLVLSRETLRSLGADGRTDIRTGSVDDSCNETLCTTESGCYAAKQG
jgi:hypothetical protein